MLISAPVAGGQDQKNEFVRIGWSEVAGRLYEWIEIAEQYPCMNMTLGSALLTVALDRHVKLDKGVAQIEAPHVWSAVPQEHAIEVSVPAPRNYGAR